MTHTKPMDPSICLGVSTCDGNSAGDGANDVAPGCTVTKWRHQTFLSSKPTRTDIVDSIVLFELRKWGTVKRMAADRDYVNRFVTTIRALSAPSGWRVLWPEAPRVISYDVNVHVGEREDL